MEVAWTLNGSERIRIIIGPYDIWLTVYLIFCRSDWENMNPGYKGVTYENTINALHRLVNAIMHWQERPYWPSWSRGPRWSGNADCLYKRLAHTD